MRLTGRMKEAIEDIVINKTFEARKIALDKANTALFRAVLAEVIPKDFKPTSKTENWFPAISKIDLRRLDSIGHAHSFYITGDSTRVPFYLVDEYHSKIIVQEEKLSKKVKQQADFCHTEREKIKKDKEALGRKVRAILNSASTDKRLKEIWPEVENYYQFVEPTKNLPAVIDVGGLNQAIEQMSKAA